MTSKETVVADSVEFEANGVPYEVKYYVDHKHRYGVRSRLYRLRPGWILTSRDEIETQSVYDLSQEEVPGLVSEMVRSMMEFAHDREEAMDIDISVEVDDE